MNQFIFTGNTTQDLTLSTNHHGNHYTKITLAINDYDYSVKKEITYFFDILISGKRVQKIVELCGKGSKILIQGKITKNETSNKNEDGKVEKSYYTNFVASSVEFLYLKAPNQNSSDKITSTLDQTNQTQSQPIDNLDQQISKFSYPIDVDNSL